MNKEKCKIEGHKLREVCSVIGYQCKRCGFYIRKDTILKIGFGHCPRCEAPKEKLESCFWGASYIAYTCKNCGYNWKELI